MQRRIDGILQHFGAYADMVEACIQHDISLIRKKGWNKARSMSINLDLGVHRDPRVLELEGHEPSPEVSAGGGQGMEEEAPGGLFGLGANVRP